MIAHADLGARGVVDSDIAEVLRLVAQAARPPYWALTPQQARVAYEKAAPILDLPPRAVHRVDDVSIALDGREIATRWYWPREPNGWQPCPTLVWLHGGGFTVGSIATDASVARMLCREVDCCVVCVDYRLAPEHRFPAAFDDAWAVVRWVAAQGASIGVDASRLAVGGDSAGGTLAAACAIAARDAALPLALQCLVYPGTSAHQDTRSHRAYADGYLLDRKTIAWFFDQYVRDDADRADWRFAPLEARDVRGVAPAWIGVAEFDPLVDEGVDYARKLRAAHCDVALAFYPGAIHAFFHMGGRVALARKAHADVVAALRRAFA